MLYLPAVITVFFGPAKSEAAAHAHESPAVMTVPLVILSAFALFAGYAAFGQVQFRQRSESDADFGHRHQ